MRWIKLVRLGRRASDAMTQQKRRLGLYVMLLTIIRIWV